MASPVGHAHAVAFNALFAPSLMVGVRDSEGVEISYEDTDEIERMRKELRSYNTYLQGHQLGLSLPVAEIRKIL